MKPITVIFALTTAILFWGCTNEVTDKSQTVNPIIGDISFVKKFGHHPDTTTDDVVRIKTHLEYVENILRAKDVSALPANLQHKRNYLLDLLHEYRTAGIFPKNYDYPGERKPCFIDKDNAICAVGFLIEQTAGRQVAELINSKHKYDELLAMNDANVDEWISSSGLTKEECAMIQPAYERPDNDISAGYAISSSVFTGLNVSLNVINLVQSSKGVRRNGVGVGGLYAGAGQIILGIAMYPEKKYTNWHGLSSYTNENERILSMINIGLGTTTMILSTWNLITNRKPKEKLTAWNIYALPPHNNKVGIGASWTRKF